MKNITKSLFLLLSVFAVSCSGDDVEDRPVIVPTDAPVLTAPDGGEYVLTIEDAALQADRFVWTSANFDQDVAITYTLEIAAAGTEFAEPVSLGSVVGENSLSVSVETLNNAVMATGAAAFEPAQFDVRVKASVNDTFEPLYSEAITIGVTPYTSVVPSLYLVGHPQAYYGVGEWSPENGLEMRYIGDGVTKLYEAYVKVAPGNGLKFVDELSWNGGNFGVIDGAQDGNLKNGSDSGDLKIAETDGEGLYYIQVDIDNLTYKAVKMNWGIIGAATPSGWGAETPMNYNFAENRYELTVDLTVENMKFRSKNTGDYIYSNEWKFQVGNSDPMVAYDNGSGDIPVATAGSHDIKMSIDIQGNVTVEGL